MKKILLGVATLALMAGCSKSEVTDINSKAPGQIRLEASSTRGAIQTVDDTFKQGGFPVWATTPGVSDAWYTDIDGTNAHVYDAGEASWGFDNPVAWPTDAAKYPMTFYAIYPAPGSNGLTMAATPATALTATFEVNDVIASQIDLLSSQAIANVKPANDHLAITFSHLLSKIDFSVTMGYGYDALIQGVSLNNVSKEGSYPLMATTPAWTATATYESDYLYAGTLYSNPTGNPTSGAVATIGRDGDADPAVAVPFYAGTHSNHLMLIPQNVPAQTWDPAATATGDGAVTTNPNNYVTTDGILTTTASYISMIYRMTTSGHDYVGYTNASSHPAYAATAATNGLGENDPLYVKVGYPFTLNWMPGKGYTYNIVLGATSGGLLIDQNYYDQYGNRTDLKVGAHDDTNTPTTPVVPEPVIGGDTYIHLVPTISSWDDSDPAVALNL